MRQYKYTGLFLNGDGHEYTSTVLCNGTMQAFFLLTADAIRSARHYQLSTITDEKGKVTSDDSILKVRNLLN